ncbi:hypothetical protein Leryth_012502 [Lithospermum erythrorhizon]|nr:hypothetical protein Leryth_012502 [Lithospermum erythrorhizon]
MERKISRIKVKWIDRMKWEQEKIGMLSIEKNEVRVEIRGERMGWSEFGSYILVESFVLKKMDESTILTYNFRHTHQIKSKWEGS